MYLLTSYSNGLHHTVLTKVARYGTTYLLTSYSIDSIFNKSTVARCCTTYLRTSYSIDSINTVTKVKDVASHIYNYIIQY